jgi:hypothetical protein
MPEHDLTVLIERVSGFEVKTWYERGIISISFIPDACCFADFFPKKVAAFLA